MTTTRLRDLMHQLQAQQDDVRATTQALISEIDALIGERVAIAQTLAEFYAAPISLSSVQPVLDLAVRLKAQTLPVTPVKVDALATRSAWMCGCDVGAGWTCERHR